MALDIVSDWATAKNEYFALTKEKKPRETFMKFFKTSHSGISSAISAIAAFNDLGANDKKKNAKTLAGLIATYNKEATSYIKLLSKLIEDEDKLTEKGTVVTEKGLEPYKLKTDRMKGLKMLKSKLENYASAYDASLVLRKSLEGGVSKIEMLDRQFEVGMKNGFKRFFAAANAIKATPTPAVWNREMHGADGVRSLTTAMGAYRAIEKEIANLKSINPLDATTMSELQTTKLVLAKQWNTTLMPWANGDTAPRKQPDTATDQELIAELKKCAAQVKACKAAFGM